MDVRLIPLKIKEQLNKLSSFDYDNIECWQFVEAFNKAQLEKVRVMLKGNTASGFIAEETIDRIDDLQPIIVSNLDLKGNNKEDFFETTKIPENYIRFSRLDTVGFNKDCPGKSINITDIAETSNVSVYKRDYTKRPNFKWGETFATLQSGSFRIYTNNEFKISSVKLTYFRLPRPISLAGCEDLDGNIMTNVDPEFKDDFVEVLITDAAKIIASRIESLNQYQILTGESDRTT